MSSVWMGEHQFCPSQGDLDRLPGQHPAEEQHRHAAVSVRPVGDVEPGDHGRQAQRAASARHALGAELADRVGRQPVGEAAQRVSLGVPVVTGQPAVDRAGRDEQESRRSPAVGHEPAGRDRVELDGLVEVGALAAHHRRVQHVGEVVGQAVEAVGAHVPPPGPHAVGDQVRFDRRVAEPAERPDLVARRQRLGDGPGYLAGGAGDEDLRSGQHVGISSVAGPRAWPDRPGRGGSDRGGSDRGAAELGSGGGGASPPSAARDGIGAVPSAGRGPGPRHRVSSVRARSLPAGPSLSL